MNQLTVNKAIKKGHQMVNYPIFAIMIIGFGITFYLLTIKTNGLFTGMIGISTFATMWLWWSIQITRWKILAFSNVRNVHELKRKAIEQQLIWNDDSWFNKTEIWSSEQIDKWQEIEYKFLSEDEFETIHDNGDTNNSTVVKNSVALKWVYSIMTLACSILAYIFICDNEIFLSIVLIGVAIFGGAFLLPKILDDTPQIILTNEGIKFKDAEMVSWNEVENASVILQGRGRSSQWFLNVEYLSKDSNGKFGKYIDLSNFQPSPGKIEELIKIYRQREMRSKNR